MRRVSKFWLLSAVVLAGLGLWHYLRQSATDPIRRNLEAIARALEFEGSPPGPAWERALRSRVAQHLSNPITIYIDSLGESTYDSDSVIEYTKVFASRYDALKITLSNVGVNVDSNGMRASAKGEVYLDLLDRSKERRGEPRRFTATLERTEQGWVVVHARVSEPRIDQPEARP